MGIELVAALVGAAAGAILALFGGAVQVFMQARLRERGKITYDVAAWQLTFSIGLRDRRPDRMVRDGMVRSVDPYPWERARTLFAELGSSEYIMEGAHHSFTVNFLNTKGTNAALLAYSVEFLKGKQTVMTLLPTPHHERVRTTPRTSGGFARRRRYRNPYDE